MAYLEEFKQRIEKNDFPKFMQLWEEYSHGDMVDSEEFKQILIAIRNSDFIKNFNSYLETALPIWKMVQDPNASYEILRLLTDLQITPNNALSTLALEAVKNKFEQHPQFKEKLRLVQARKNENNRGLITNFELLAHLAPHKFVFHAGGWGTGEIIDVSSIREQLVIEFENVGGRKDVSFENAFRTLIPLPDDHFLARRFGNPDQLEEEARNHPVEIIQLLLKDLGPKSAAEIKDELCEWVIPEADWVKWWQTARAKIKKDTHIESPTNIRDPFRLHQREISHEERMQKEMLKKTDPQEIVQTSYSYVRDFPNMLKKPEVQKSIEQKLLALLEDPNLTPDLELQTVLFLEQLLNHKVPGKSIPELIQKSSQEIEIVVQSIEIQALKKRALVAIQENCKNWPDIFLRLLFAEDQPTPLRDYLFAELNKEGTRPLLEKQVEDLLQHPEKHPEPFVWCFQKAVSQKDFPYHHKKGQTRFLESFLILYQKIEFNPEHRDLIKKMYNLIAGKRFAIIRQIIEGSSLEFIKEFLLLVSKCQTLGDHDIQILRSLAQVVHPSLSPKNEKKIDLGVVWTTEEGYRKTQEHIRHLGTVEIVDNAREIEAARALGDLRENSEYKAALERRSRLQAELKSLSEQLNKARIITKDDIPKDEVGVGSIITLQDAHSKKATYTILGPWDADAEKNILSFQSKLAQAMIGCKKSDIFKFKGEDFTVLDIQSFLNK